MLQKSTKKALVEDVLKRGLSYSDGVIQLKYLRNINNTAKRPQLFAFVVSSKTEKLAVKRNLLKRRGRHIVRNDNSLIDKDYDCVFFFKKGVSMLSFKELEGKIVFLLRKAKIIR